MSVSHPVLFELFGGLSVGLTMNFVGGKVGFAHRGLNFLFFVADPAKPLDGNLRATIVRIASAKTSVTSCTWGGGGNLQCFCKMQALALTGQKRPSVEDMSQLFEKLKVSLGGVSVSDGSLNLPLKI